MRTAAALLFIVSSEERGKEETKLEEVRYIRSLTQEMEQIMATDGRDERVFQGGEEGDRLASCFISARAHACALEACFKGGGGGVDDIRAKD